MFVLAVMLLLLPVQDEPALRPDPPVAGRAVVISAAAEKVHLSSPFASWRVEARLDEGRAEISLPSDLPVLLVGLPEGNESRFEHRLWLVNGLKDATSPRAYFWKGYLLAGFPAPYPIGRIDLEAALVAAQSAVKQEPEYLPATELMWRLRGISASDKTAFLKQVDAELASDASGRLAMAAIRLHSQMGDKEGALAVARLYKDEIEPITTAETKLWTEIVSTSNPKTRLRKLHEWLDRDPFSDYLPHCLQLLAATYSAVEDFRSTALFGLLSLELTPDDAMTLNGVAFAMAEGGFELEKGLELVEDALEILMNPDSLRKPPQLSDTQWKRELNHATAACLDTKGWLLFKLGILDEAHRALEMAIQLEGVDEFYLHLGLTLKKQGKPDEARRALRTGLKLSGFHRAEIEAALDELEQ